MKTFTMKFLDINNTFRIISRVVIFSFFLVAVESLPAQSVKTLKEQIKILNDSIGSLNDSIVTLHATIAKLTVDQQVTTGNSSLPASPVLNSYQADSLLKRENDSLRRVLKEQYNTIYNGGAALLFVKYDGIMEEYATILSEFPDSLKQAHTYGMWKEMKNMMMHSKAEPINLREKAWEVISRLPQEVLKEEDRKIVVEVLQNVEENYPKYSPVQHAIEMLASVPKSKDLSEVLTAYKSANEEIRSVLQKIAEQAKTTSDYSKFSSQIRSTQYYKKYYNANLPIFYLNEVIDEAMKRIEEASGGKRLKLQDLINKL